MADTGNALALHRGGGGEQCARGREDDAVKFSLPQTGQEMRTKHRRAAPAAACAAVHILPLAVIEQQTAVGIT